MSIIEQATRRRVTVAMVGVLMVVFGALALNQLKVNLLPDLSYPTLTIRTEYEGAAPIEMEKLITQPIEEQVGVVRGVKVVKSVSRASQSDVILEFGWGANMDEAGLDVREKLELLQLPLEAKRPVLLRFDPSTDPIIRLALFDANSGELFDENSLKEVRRFAEEELKKRLEPIDGVAAVKVSGGLEDEIQINIDQHRLAQLGISIATIVQRLREENVNVSGGRLEEGTQRYLVRTVNQFQTIQDFRELIISTGSGRPVFLRDVARVSHGYKERQAIIRTNNREAVEMAIYKEGDANTVRVAAEVIAVLEELKENLPEGMELIIVDDQSVFIRQAINDVTKAAIFGGLLAVLVIYFFLGDAWATMVISTSIPLSIVATFFLMDQADLSLNIMSLGGIALAVGLLVDNAIVVLENISRHRAQGASVVDAAVRGASEVSGAVFASTLTTIAVFLPLIFVEGIGGQLFRDQALTVTFALLVSLAVALTMIPMLSSLKVKSPVAFPDEEFPTQQPRTRIGGWMRRARLFSFDSAPSVLLAVIFGLFALLGAVLGFFLRPVARVVMRAYDWVSGHYVALLPWALRNRFFVLLVAGLAFGLSVNTIPQLGAELIPQMIQGRFEMSVKMAPGTPLAKTDSVVSRIQKRALEVAGIDRIYAVSGTGNRIDANPTEAGENIGNLLVVMEDDTGAAEEAAAMEELRAVTGRIPGVQTKFNRPELFSMATPLEIHVIGYDLEKLKSVSDQIARELARSPRFVDVKASLEEGHPEIQILFDQERAAQLGLTVRQISDQVVKQLRGEVATRFSFRDRKIDVLVRAEEADRSSVEDIRNIIINPESDRPLTLQAVAEIIATEGPAEINRVDQERAAVVAANLRFGTLKEAVAEAELVLSRIKLPYGIKLRMGGQSEEMNASFKSLLFALGLAIFLVYLVMASQFESLIHPLVILFSVPLALVGVVGSLILTGTPISIVVFIGVIMLAGIVVNNAIVLVDLINQLRQRGMEKHAAIIEGGRARLRPIIMTTLTTTLGLMPLALGVGDGAEVRAPMAITVIGGLMVSTLLTLLVVPVMYDLLDRRARVDQASQVASALADPSV